jgi:lysophospholipase L1-like esterase
VKGTFSKLNAVLVGKATNAFEVIVDGASIGSITMVDNQKVYPVATGLTEGAHTVTLFKRTESWSGTVQFLGFQVPDDAALDTPVVPTRRIEFLGDSITCGYGNEAKSQQEHFTPATENAWLAWGAVASRALDAELSVEAISGIWLQDNGKKKPLPAIWDQTLPFSSTAKWDFSRWQADVVVVNLGTNDSGAKVIDEEKWGKAYREFIASIRKAYPQAHIFLTIGSMGHGPQGVIPQYNTKLVAALAAEGETKVHAVAIANQDQRNGIGADWHPSIKTHQLMADQIAAEIRSVMKW